MLIVNFFRFYNFSDKQKASDASSDFILSTVRIEIFTNKKYEKHRNVLVFFFAFELIVVFNFHELSFKSTALLPLFVKLLIIAASGSSVVRNYVTDIFNARYVDKKSFKSHTEACVIASTVLS